MWAKIASAAKAVAPQVIGGAFGLGGSALSAAASAKQAEKQMDFQREMSNTAYQRAATDMEAAGLNRILAIGSPATTPGGAMGNVPDFGASMLQGAGMGNQYQQTQATIKQSDANIKQILQNTKNLSAKEKSILAQSEIMSVFSEILQKSAGKDGTNVTTLMQYLQNGQVLEDASWALKQATSDVKNAFSKLLKYHLGPSSNWIMEKLGSTIPTGATSNNY